MVRFITSSILLVFAVLCFASAPSTADVIINDQGGEKDINPNNCTYMKSQLPKCTTYVIQCRIDGPITCSTYGFCATITDQDKTCEPDDDSPSKSDGQQIAPFGLGPASSPTPDGQQYVNNNDEPGDTTSAGVSNLLGNFGVATTGALLLGLL